jgi:nudix-type nucleoside diphosphatase (YffH/AdpP family)
VNRFAWVFRSVSPRILDRRTVYSGYLSVETLRVLLSDGVEVIREVESHGNAVAVLPYDGSRKTILTVALLRLPAFDLCGDVALEEACAGMIEDEDAEATARREAMEELGVRLGDMEFVGRLWPSPGVCSERVSLFLAPYGIEDRISAGGGLAAEHENITVIERAASALAREADEGRIVDLKLLALVQTLRLRRPALFLD